MTVCIGIIECNEGDDVNTVEELISHADNALYKGKKAGRNKNILYQEN